MNYQHDSTSYAVSIEPLAQGSYRVVIDGRALLVGAQKVEGGWLLTLDGRQITVYAAARGSERFVALDGESYTLSIPEARRRVAGAGSGGLTAQMPGQVREVYVQPGDEVTRGQPLLLLEAMKMEIRVAAPADGRVRRVLVAAGQVVDRGQSLVELAALE